MTTQQTSEQIMKPFFHKKYEDWTVIHQTIGHLINELNNGDIKIPEYQRNLVWTPKQQNSFLKTISEGGFVPSIVLNVKPNGSCEVIDGQNRLLTLQRFVNNEMKTNFSILDENGNEQIIKLKWEDISLSQQRKFRNISIPIHETNNWDIKDCCELFKIIQFGTKLNHGEILHSQQYTNFVNSIKLILEECPLVVSSDKLNIQEKRYKHYEFVGALIVAQIKGITNADMGKTLVFLLESKENVHPNVTQKIIKGLKFYEKIFSLTPRLTNTPKPNLSTHLLNIYYIMNYIMNEVDMIDNYTQDVSHRLNTMMTIVQDPEQYEAHEIAIFWGEDGRTHTQPLKRWERIKPVYDYFFVDLEPNE